MIKIKGFPEYTIDEKCRVFSTKNKTYISPSTVNGYKIFRLRNGKVKGNGEQMYTCKSASKLMATAFFKLKPTERLAFKDGDPMNCTLENLYVVKKVAPLKKPQPKKTVNYDCDCSWMGSGFQI